MNAQRARMPFFSAVSLRATRWTRLAAAVTGGVLAWGAVSAGARYLLGDGGALATHAGLDAGAWLPYLYLAAALVFASGPATVLERRGTATILLWSGFGALAFGLLSESPRLAPAAGTPSPIAISIVHALDSAGISSLAPWAELVFILIGLIRAFDARLGARLRRRSRPDAALLARYLGIPLALAAAAYLGLGADGYIARATGIDAGFLLPTAYAALGLWALAGTAAVFIPAPQGQSARAALKGTALLVAAVGLLSGIPALTEGLQHNIVSGPLRFDIRPFLLPWAAATPWIAVLIVVLTAYHASAPFWTRSAFWQGRLARSHPAAGRILARGAVAALLSYVLLHPEGPVTHYAGVDVSFLTPTAAALAGMLTAARLLRIPGAKARRFSLASLLAWGAWAQFSYFLLHGLSAVAVDLATHLPTAAAGDRALPYLALLAKLDVWAAGILGAIAAYRAAAPCLSLAPLSRYAPVIRAGFSLLLSVGALGVSGRLAPLGEAYSVAGVIAFSALAAVSAGYLAAYLARSNSPLIATAAGWASASPFRNANIGGFIALYATVIRPAIYDAFVFAPVLEWIGLAAPGLYVLRRTWTAATPTGTQDAAPPRWPSWRPPKAPAMIVPDASFARVTAVQREFLAHGRTSRFIVQLATSLWDRGAAEDEISRVIEPLVTHREPPRGLTARLVESLPGFGATARRRIARRRQHAYDRVRDALKRLDAAARPGTRDNEPDAAARERAANRFTVAGRKSPLVASLVAAAWYRGASRGMLDSGTRLLLEHRDVPRRWFMTPGVRRRLVAINRARRRGVVDALRSALLHNVGLAGAAAEHRHAGEVH